MSQQISNDSEAFERVGNALSHGAEHQISFERDSDDNYVIQVENRVHGEPVLSREDVLPLIPKGSQWSPACGWRSFFGRVATLRERPFLALGGQRVVRHASRGAYPVLRAALFSIPQTSPNTVLGRTAAYNTALSRAVQAIRRSTHQPLVAIPQDVSGVIATDDANPGQHVDIEASLMEAANTAYQFGKYMEFRTLIMCDSEVQEYRSKSKLLSSVTTGFFLLATVPSITRSLSKQSQKWLRDYTLSFESR
jgi:hypothetical protein